MVSKSTPSPSPKTKIDQAIDGLFAYLQRRWQLLALVILYIFYRPSFESKLVALLQSFEPSWGSFIVWCGIIVIALTYTYALCRRRYVISEGVLSWTVVLLVGWAYYRFIDTHYIAIPTPIAGVCYVDLLPILGSCVALVVGWSHWKHAKTKQEGVHNSRLGYEVECPCTSEDEDLLGRRKEAQDLAEKIFQTDTSNAAFTIGLTAPWGAGKTSFMLAMKDYLEKRHSDETILLDFNPWMYRKAPNLTQVFFEELSRALAPYNSALASGFTRYVDHILDKDDSAWLRLGVRLLPQGFKAKSTSEQYEFLKKEIGKLGRKIVIFIDDVDRLDSEELIELFSLIRNSSLSFPYMSYILTYDKEYVASQLQKKFNEHSYRYIEKILQEEYPLAKITPEQLEEALRLELKRIGYGDLWRDIKNSGFQLSYHLPTLRVIKRICNTLSSRRKELDSNVALFDWFIMELIRIQYPDLFNFLKGNYEQTLNCYIDRWSIKLKLEEFNTYLQGHKVNIQHRDTRAAFILMNLLWGQYREAAPCQANHRLYIERYFNGILRATEIDESEFRKHMSLPFDKSYIEEKLRKGQLKDFASKLKQDYRNINSTEKAEKYLRTALYIGSIKYSKVLFEETDIDQLIHRLQENLDDEEELKKKIEDIFNDQELMRGVLLYLSMATVDDYGHTSSTIKLLGIPELRKKKEQLFLEYIKELSPTGSYLLWCECRTYSSEPDNSPPIACRSTKMDEKIKEIIVENIEKIIPHFIGGSHGSYRLLLPEPIWSLDTSSSESSNDYFPNFIFGLDDNQSPIIKEFKKFLNRWIKREEEADEFILSLPEEERTIELSDIYFEFKHIIPAGITEIIKHHQNLYDGWGD
jgi:hypothetical protein